MIFSSVAFRCSGFGVSVDIDGRGTVILTFVVEGVEFAAEKYWYKINMSDIESLIVEILYIYLSIGRINVGLQR